MDTRADVVKPKTSFLPMGVNVIFAEINKIDGVNNHVVFNTYQSNQKSIK
jgi:hypothetical protein